MEKASGKVLVLGGMGFIGSNLLPLLLDHGYSIRMLIREDNKKNVNSFGHQVEIIKGDFRDFDSFNELLGGIKSVIHLIHSSFPGSKNDDPLADVRDNLIPTLKLIRACIDYRIEKFIFISSGGAVYGRHQSLPLDEQHPLNPISSYGLTKLAIERYLQYYTTISDLHTVILRVSNPYGLGQKMAKNQGLIGVFANQIRAGKSFQVYGDGQTIRDFILVDDVVEAIRLVLVDKTIKFDIFNIGSGEGHSVNEIIQIFQQLVDRMVKVEYLEERSIDVPVNILNANKFKKKYGWNGRGLLIRKIKELLEN